MQEGFPEERIIESFGGCLEVNWVKRSGNNGPGRGKSMYEHCRLKKMKEKFPGFE